jgi:hypothetical protein
VHQTAEEEHPQLVGANLVLLLNVDAGIAGVHVVEGIACIGVVSISST